MVATLSVVFAVECVPEEREQKKHCMKKKSVVLLETQVKKCVATGQHRAIQGEKGGSSGL